MVDVYTYRFYNKENDRFVRKYTLPLEYPYIQDVKATAKTLQLSAELTHKVKTYYTIEKVKND